MNLNYKFFAMPIFGQGRHFITSHSLNVFYVYYDIHVNCRGEAGASISKTEHAEETQNFELETLSVGKNGSNRATELDKKLFNSS